MKRGGEGEKNRYRNRYEVWVGGGSYKFELLLFIIYRNHEISGRKEKGRAYQYFIIAAAE